MMGHWRFRYVFFASYTAVLLPHAADPCLALLNASELGYVFFAGRAFILILGFTVLQFPLKYHLRTLNPYQNQGQPTGVVLYESLVPNRQIVLT